MRALGVFARLARVPGSHVAGGNNRPFRVEDRNQRLGIFAANILPHMLDDFAEIQSDNESASKLVLIEQRRRNFDLPRLNKYLHQANEPGQ